MWKDRPGLTITMKRFDGRVIDIKACENNLGDKSVLLLALHAISEGDSVSYPYGQGKLSFIKVMMKYDLLFLNNIGELNTPDCELLEIGSKVFGLMYCGKDTYTMNDARFKMFSRQSAKTPRLKSLPPTNEPLIQHMKRCHLQIITWSCPSN